MIKKIFVNFLFFSFFFTNFSFAEIITSVNISGNKKVSESTIKSFINLKKDKNYELKDLNEMQKKLYESNFFKNIKINLNNNILKIDVVENPLIQFFYIEGILNKERENFIYKNIKLSQNKIFSENYLKHDLELIRKVFHSGGYLDVTIDPIISELENKNINLIIKIDRKNKYKVKNILFIGNKNIKSSDLVDAIESSEYGWWKFLSSSSNLNEQRVNYDKKLIKEYYMNEGFYDALVTSSEINVNKNFNADIIFSINEGKKYKFGKINLIDKYNNLNKENFSEIKKIISSEIKKNYSLKKIKKLRKNINEFLIQKKIDFVAFDILENKSDNQTIDISFSFYNEPKTFVNLVDIVGNSITEEKVIRSNLEFSAGDSFTKYKLEKSLDNLKSSGIFKSVEYKAQQISKDLVDIKIILEEQPTGSIFAGVGVGSSGSAISGGVNEKNLFGKGIQVSSNVSVGTEKIQGKIGFTIPDFNNSGNSFNNDIFAISSDYTNAGYESTLVGNNSSITYEVYEDISLHFGVGLDHDDISVSSSASSLYQSRKGQYITFRSFYKIEKDKRNRKFRTTSGYRTGFGQTLAMPGSDIEYIKNTAYGNFFYPISDNYIFNLRSGLSSINSIDNNDVKLSDRLFLSNKQLRGFETRGIGPVDGQDHIGGNYSAYASFSTTFPNPFPDKWQADSSLFLDTANVWGVDFSDSYDRSKLRSSVGVSLSWFSPIGPLSFTLANTLSEDSSDKSESFSFQIGSTF